MHFSPALEIIQLSCGLTCWGHLSFNCCPPTLPVLVGLTCGNWAWDCLIAGLGILSWFWETGSGLGLPGSGKENRNGEHSRKTSASG